MNEYSQHVDFVYHGVPSELLGSLAKPGDKRAFSEPYRFADGYFHKGSATPPQLPGAHEPPSWGTSAWVALQDATVDAKAAVIAVGGGAEAGSGCGVTIMPPPKNNGSGGDKGGADEVASLPVPSTQP